MLHPASKYPLKGALRRLAGVRQMPGNGEESEKKKNKNKKNKKNKSIASASEELLILKLTIILYSDDAIRRGNI